MKRLPPASPVTVTAWARFSAFMDRHYPKVRRRLNGKAGKGSKGE